MSTLLSVARAIAGGDPPRWLIDELLERFGDPMTKLSMPEPSPATQRKALEEILKHIQRIKAKTKIDSIDLLTSLELSELAERMESETQAALAGHKPKRQGRYAPTGMTAATECAVIVCELWEKCRGKWPTNNAESRRACAELYAEIGGGPTKEDKDGFWRKPLQEAKRQGDRNSKIESISIPPLWGIEIRK
jgi:hypothetical protein